jgi:hypothetical protein
VTEGEDKFYFVFDIVRGENGYRCRVLSKPHIERSLARSDMIHLLVGEDGVPYICVTAPVADKKRMRDISEYWAKCFVKYIKYGIKY